MRRTLSITLLCLALAGLAGAHVPAADLAAPAVAPAAADSAVNATPALTTATADPLAGIAAAGFPNPTYCGDPCSPPGSKSGCIDTSSNPWRRTTCTCSGSGYWVC